MGTFDLTSDIHTDINKAWIWKANSPVLVIAGDINNDHTKVGPELEAIASRYKNVLLVLGNHDYYSTRRYGDTMDEATRYIIDTLPENCILLDPMTNQSVLIDGVRFVGCNGWYDLKECSYQRWQANMNDARLINWGKDEPKMLAEHSARWLEDGINKCSEKLVVITHVAPSAETIDTTRYGDTPLNWAYVNTNMTPLLEKYKERIIHWCYGHNHCPADFISKEGVHLVSEPRGYMENRDGHPPFNGPKTLTF